jgi:hypothetical protein
MSCLMKFHYFCFLGVMGQSKWLIFDPKNRKGKLGRHPNPINKNLTMAPNFYPCPREKIINYTFQSRNSGLPKTYWCATWCLCCTPAGNIKQAKGTECSQYKSTAAWAVPLAAGHSYFQQNPTTYWLKERKILDRQKEMNVVISKSTTGWAFPFGSMTFLFPTKPYYLLAQWAGKI